LKFEMKDSQRAKIKFPKIQPPAKIQLIGGVWGSWMIQRSWDGGQLDKNEEKWRAETLASEKRSFDEEPKATNQAAFKLHCTAQCAHNVRQ
jgi:hypothetical protein